MVGANRGCRGGSGFSHRQGQPRSGHLVCGALPLAGRARLRLTCLARIRLGKAGGEGIVRNSMDATARIETPAREEFMTEVRRFWGALPDKAVFGVLLAAWVLLFHYYGWTTEIAGRTGSLFDWMWGKWDDPSNDASHGKLIPWVVLFILW